MIERNVNVRASSWGALFDCAHRWEGIHILKLRSPGSLRQQLGTAIHASTAAHDTARMNGENPDPMETAAVMVDTLKNPRSEIDYSSDDITYKEAEAIGLTLHGKYCTQVSPRYEFVAVELQTKPMEIDCGDGVVVTLTGTMDRARVVKNEYGVRIADVKTGARATTTTPRGSTVAVVRPHIAQLGAYEMLYEHTTGELVTGPAEVIAMSTGKREIAIGHVVDARKRLIGTDESPGLIQYAAEMFRSGLFPPNPQSRLCGSKYCPRWGTCIHHD